MFARIERPLPKRSITIDYEISEADVLRLLTDELRKEGHDIPLTAQVMFYQRNRRTDYHDETVYGISVTHQEK